MTNPNQLLRLFLFRVMAAALLSLLCIAGCGNNTADGAFEPEQPVVQSSSRSFARQFQTLQQQQMAALPDLGIRPRVASPDTPWTAAGNVPYAADRYAYHVRPITPSTPGGSDAIYETQFFGFLSAIPPFSASFNAALPNLNVNSLQYISSPEALPPSVRAVLTNNLTGDSLGVSGLDLPTGANVVYTESITTHERWYRSGVVYYPSHWAASFHVGSGWEGRARYGYPYSQGEGAGVAFWLTNGQISIANATAVHNESGHSLNFQISTANATLQGWTVDLRQQGRILRSFPPSIDNRGPGVVYGTNPTSVRLEWDGRAGNGSPVTGEFEWIVTATTTDYIAGGSVNDGVNSAQFILNDHLDTFSGEVKRIDAVTIPIVDIHNQPISYPQYDIDRQRREPFALPVRPHFSDEIYTKIQINFPPGSEEREVFWFWGETPAGEIIFGPTTHITTPGVNNVSFIYNMKKIRKIPRVDWYFRDKFGEGPVRSLGSTDSPIYAILDTPHAPQAKPRVDVLEFAVGTQRTHDLTNETIIAAFLSDRIYRLYKYDDEGRARHTEVLDEAGLKMRLQVSNFVPYPGNPQLDAKANCQDLSNLFHTCAAALGIQVAEVRRIDGPFYIRRVWPAGWEDWMNTDDIIVNFHQTGFWLQGDTVFDPAYRLDNNNAPEMQINKDPERYRLLLQDQSRKKQKWKEHSPVRVTEVY